MNRDSSDEHEDRVAEIWRHRHRQDDVEYGRRRTDDEVERLRWVQREPDAPSAAGLWTVEEAAAYRTELSEHKKELLEMIVRQHGTGHEWHRRLAAIDVTEPSTRAALMRLSELVTEHRRRLAAEERRAGEDPPGAPTSFKVWQLRNQRQLRHEQRLIGHIEASLTSLMSTHRLYTEIVRSLYG